MGHNMQLVHTLTTILQRILCLPMFSQLLIGYVCPEAGA